ncbi:MAG: adenylosuccinate lyase [Elusimicrobiaceae bacterium]|nr:adenylosuccinate lyase [Elusimicrobiaceae bacterium]
MNDTVLCPLDGRYSNQLGTLRECMGEAALAVCRLRTETAWLEVLAGVKLPGLKPLSASEKKILAQVCRVTPKELSILHALEFDGYQQFPATRHDVKAIEYFLRLKLQNTSFKNRLNWLHFALTSEDVNSVSYALMLADGVEKTILPALIKLQQKLLQLARKEAGAVLLARTHGQPAVPTTFGKEIRVFETRLARQIAQLKKCQISCKFGGAVGNFNAHVAAFPAVSWPRAARQIITRLNKGRKIKIYLTPVSTQVDPRDSYAELFDNMRRAHVILIDLCRDIWQYISAGLVKQQAVKGEVGSSTMPQKINPISFENAEGNLQLSNALLNFFAGKLPLSRLQRDLSDSTVLRNMGMSFGYACVAYYSLQRGLEKIAFDRRAAREEINAHPEVLAEAFQTVLRASGITNPYEKLRDLTRGRRITREALQQFVLQLNLPEKTKKYLCGLRPEKYTGLAEKLARGKYD